jgi:hypothetical protein
MSDHSQPELHHLHKVGSGIRAISFYVLYLKQPTLAQSGAGGTWGASGVPGVNASMPGSRKAHGTAPRGRYHAWRCRCEMDDGGWLVPTPGSRRHLEVTPCRLRAHTETSAIYE